MLSDTELQSTPSVPPVERKMGWECWNQRCDSSWLVRSHEASVVSEHSGEGRRPDANKQHTLS